MEPEFCLSVYYILLQKFEAFLSALLRPVRLIAGPPSLALTELYRKSWEIDCGRAGTPWAGAAAGTAMPQDYPADQAVLATLTASAAGALEFTLMRRKMYTIERHSLRAAAGGVYGTRVPTGLPPPAIQFQPLTIFPEPTDSTLWTFRSEVAMIMCPGSASWSSVIDSAMEALFGDGTTWVYDDGLPAAVSATTREESETLTCGTTGLVFMRWATAEETRLHQWVRSEFGEHVTQGGDGGNTTRKIPVSVALALIAANGVRRYIYPIHILCHSASFCGCVHLRQSGTRWEGKRLPGCVSPALRRVGALWQGSAELGPARAAEAQDTTQRCLACAAAGFC